MGCGRGEHHRESTDGKEPATEAGKEQGGKRESPESLPGSRMRDEHLGRLPGKGGGMVGKRGLIWHPEVLCDPRSGTKRFITLIALFCACAQTLFTRSEEC